MVFAEPEFSRKYDKYYDSRYRESFSDSNLNRIIHTRLAIWINVKIQLILIKVMNVVPHRLDTPIAHIFADENDSQTRGVATVNVE